MNESVLVFDEKFMKGFKDFEEGSWSTDFGWFDYVLNHAFFLKRGVAEEDKSYKQIIPYILFKCEDLYLAYERCGDESRLTGRISVGIGGHIDLADVDSTLVCKDIMMDTLTTAALRELDEELKFPEMRASIKFMSVSTYLAAPEGYIYAKDSESTVDQVHMGAVYQVKLTKDIADQITLRDEGKNMVWKTAEEFLEDEGLEAWSKVALENVY